MSVCIYVCQEPLHPPHTQKQYKCRNHFYYSTTITKVSDNIKIHTLASCAASTGFPSARFPATWVAYQRHCNKQLDTTNLNKKTHFR